MIINEQNILTADEDKTFIRKSDNFDMGWFICLGINPITNEQDSADNYEEVDVSEQATYTTNIL